MSNIKSDLELIKQLEQRIDKKLTKLDELEWDSVGYVQNEHNKINILGLYDCGLKELPPEIENLQNLMELDLSSNELSTLPAEIEKLQKLIWLDLSYNELSSLPAEIGNLQNLTKLDLGSNQLSSLPAEIGNLQNLTELNLSNNQLSILLAEIVKLQNLTRLDLSSNQLNLFPKTLLDLNLEVKWSSSSWKGIFVANNPFQTPPVKIVKQGRKAIIDYYATL